MREIQAPNRLIVEDTETSIFLAGSIEMGRADHWQKRVVAALKDMKNLVVFNPRRKDWDSTWIPKISNPQFREQVVWELDAMEMADIIAMYLDPTTQSPISLLELGLWANVPENRQKLVVFCPEGFWKKGNVDIVCRRYSVLQVVDEMDFILTLRGKV